MAKDNVTLGKKLSNAERLATYDGSYPLWNPRYEIAVQEYVTNGFNQRDAYIVAYKRTEEDMATMKKPWQKIFWQAEVRIRIRWILDQRRIKFENGGTKDELIALLLRRAKSCPTDYFDYDIGENGELVATPIPSKFVDGAGLDSIKFSQTQYGDKVEIKTGNTEAAVELIAKLRGDLVDKHEVNGSFNIAQNEAANEAYRRRLEKLAKKKKGK